MTVYNSHVGRNFSCVSLRFGAVIGFGVVAIGSAYAQAGFTGPDTYPQFRDLSGLAGAGFGVTRDGHVGFNGAYSLTTPIGHGLRGGEYVFGLGNRSADKKLRMIGYSADTGVNSGGSAQLLVGMNTSLGTFTFSSLWMSSQLDSVQHLQFNPKMPNGGRWGLSFGVHNIDGRGQNAGEGEPTDKKFSRSFYVAATCEYADGNYLTLGKGELRFQGFFANHTHSFNERLKYVLEYDRFGWKHMAYFGTSAPFLVYKGEPAKMFVGVGLIDGASAVWTLNFSF